ncbi:uncharacterized protein LOC122396698 [Colletes gigas]|uniref:uncharacterized protein LOC122396698 n=1 Tax=Colletes gigas TaxID=935657 RepID=UPI001C9AA48C|nr:uncharacterized protein LOC122396698 [Colletes gigas]
MDSSFDDCLRDADRWQLLCHSFQSGNNKNENMKAVPQTKSHCPSANTVLFKKLRTIKDDITSVPLNNTEIVAKATGRIDDAARPYRSRSDHNQRMCSNHQKLAPTFMTNRVQFLESHNEQLWARVKRLMRDLDLTEAVMKRGEMARADLTNRLQAYETFIAEMFRRLNGTGIVKITDESGKQIVIRKVKTKELSYMRGEKDTLVSIPEISLVKNIARRHAEATVKCKVEKVSQEMSTLPDVSIKIEETVAQSSGDDRLVSKREHTYNRRRDTYNLNETIDEPSLWVKNEFPEVVPSTVEIPSNSESPRGYVTKEAMGATNEADDNTCKDNCKIEETNRVEGKARKMKNSAVDDKEIAAKVDPFAATNSRVCCCDCHRNCSAASIANKKSGKGNAQEWALECRCDLEVANGIYRVIDKSVESLKHCLKTHATEDTSSANATHMGKLEQRPENTVDDKAFRSVSPTILITGKNDKVAIIT